MKEQLKNCTSEKDFHLLPFAISAHSQLIVFTVIFLMYTMTVLANTMIIGFICLLSWLHTPMYFFLCNLSLQDIIYISAILPKFLAIMKYDNATITFPACVSQLFLFVFCIGTEFLLLTSMAYDRYVAICAPLNYATLMNKTIYILLAAISWLVGFLNALTQSLMLSRAEFCDSQKVDHFYCDLKTMIKLASSDITHLRNFLSVITVVLGFIPFFLILASYVCIIYTIAKIRNSEGRVKAFSSCSSHLTIVFLFYGPSLGSYTIPESEHSQEKNKLISLLYTALVPLLNPLVYTLRNKEILRAIKHLKERCCRGGI